MAWPPFLPPVALLDVDKYKTSARGPLPRDRRRPARAGRGRRVRGGRLLPSEAELTRAYGASRVTVRRALESLRDEGLVDARQGFGWFVAVDRVRQSLARLSHDRARARRAGRRDRAPDPRLRVRRRERPRASGARRRPGARGAAAQPRRRRAVRPGHGVVPGRARRLACRGPTSRRGRSTSCCRSSSAEPRRRSAPRRRERRRRRARGARSARRCCAASGSRATSSDHPVLLSVHVFPAHLTEFVVDLPSPSSLSLVE